MLANLRYKNKTTQFQKKLIYIKKKLIVENNTYIRKV
jgi:hypothetical protein